MFILTAEIIQFFLDYEFIAIPILGGSVLILGVFTWKQVRRGWSFHRSKLRLLEQLRATMR